MTSLAEELAQLVNPAPTLIEPEDDVDFDTKAQVVEKFDICDVDIHQSKLRKKNIHLNLDSKYSGKKISRKKLAEDFEPESDDDEDDDDDDDDMEYDIRKNTLKDVLSSEESQDFIPGGKLTEKIKIIESDDKDGILSRSVESDSDDKEDDDEQSVPEEEEEDDDDDDSNDIVKKFSNIDVNEEIEKGKAVKSQLKLWDCLLECRIKMQKLLVLANKFPQPDNFNDFLKEGDSEYHDITKQGCTSVKKLLDLLTDLQTELLKRYPETKYVLDEQSQDKVLKSDDEMSESGEDEDNEDKSENFSDDEMSESDEDEDNEDKSENFHCGEKRKLSIDDYPDFINKRHKTFLSFRNSTIQKWNEKTKLASGKVNQNSFSAFEQSALKQIEQILNDKSRLINRTQLKRSAYQILGKEIKMEKTKVTEPGKENTPLQDQHLKEYEYDAEIFDDDDFYHHLLREIIERKTVDINDPVALRKWLEMQKIRNKIKKKVDTKATKGRKIRFKLLNKMTNFTACVDNFTTSDEAAIELFNSLFGRRM